VALAQQAGYTKMVLGCTIIERSRFYLYYHDNLAILDKAIAIYGMKL
jgi:hypothetical protein